MNSKRAVPALVAAVFLVSSVAGAEVPAPKNPRSARAFNALLKIGFALGQAAQDAAQLAGNVDCDEREDANTVSEEAGEWQGQVGTVLKLLSLEDRMKEPSDRRAVAETLTDEVRSGRRDVDLSIRRVGLALTSTNKPAIATVAAHIRDLLREVRDALESYSNE